MQGRVERVRVREKGWRARKSIDIRRVGECGREDVNGENK